MAYGYIVLASNEYPNFISKGIKWFTQSVFSHSFVTMPDILSVPMCIEAGGTGVSFQRYDSVYYDNPYEGLQIWNVKIDQAIKDKALVAILSDLETSYGFLEYPWFMWRRINLLFGRDIKSKNNWNHDGMICSQVCVAYLKACGLQSVLAGYGEGAIAPQDLQNIFMAHPELFELVESKRL